MKYENDKRCLVFFRAIGVGGEKEEWNKLFIEMTYSIVPLGSRSRGSVIVRRKWNIIEWKASLDTLSWQFPPIESYMVTTKIPPFLLSFCNWNWLWVAVPSFTSEVCFRTFPSQHTSIEKITVRRNFPPTIQFHVNLVKWNFLSIRNWLNNVYNKTIIEFQFEGLLGFHSKVPRRGCLIDREWFEDLFRFSLKVGKNFSNLKLAVEWNDPERSRRFCKVPLVASSHFRQFDS